MGLLKRRLKGIKERVGLQAKRIIFTQERIGRGGKPFTVYKLRTMKPESEKEIFEDSLRQKTKFELAAEGSHDPRVTRLGRFMRRHGIDELPQLWNVAKGEMSLVGPRPYPKSVLEKFPKEVQQEILSVKPGLLPPFYAHFAKPEETTRENIAKAYKRFLAARRRWGVLAHVGYAAKIFYNYLFKGARGV